MRIINRCPRHGRLVSRWRNCTRLVNGRAVPVFHCKACAIERLPAALFGGAR